jgi:CPA1 family monovalent cation:H+ antiporter
LVVVTLTVSLSYLTFIIAEHYYHFSGVMAVVTAALVLGSRGRTVITPNTWNLLHHTWEQIGFWANSIVFILVGMAVPVIMAGFSLNEALLLAALIISAFSARAFIVFGLIPVLGYFRLSHRVSTAFKSVIFWGGLRGAVSLALALVVMENAAIDDEIRHFVSILVTGFVLFTLLVNATTIRLVMNFFGLGNLSTIDIAVRDRATLSSLSQVATRLNQVTDELKVQSSMSQLVTGKYLNLSNRAQNKLNTMDEVKFSEWLVIGLMMLTA